MEYERIHKVQNGVISPSKLRMKLIGSQNQKNKEGSNSNSARTSPSKLEDSEFVKNSLLAAQDGEEEASRLEVPTTKCGNSSQVDINSSQSKELILMHNAEASRFPMLPVSKCDETIPGSFHPVRSCEDENLDYDSTSSFEFHKGERSLHHSVSRSFPRPMPSKWNDAEKWIMNRQNMQSNNSKKINMQNQANRLSAMDSENKLSVKRVDFCHVENKFAFASHGAASIPGQVSLLPESKDLREVDGTSLVLTKSVTEETTGTPAIRSVSMRDTGTEMTPIPSQEPSRSPTPIDATTPIRTPTTSVPSSPRRGQPTQELAENEKKELSEQELKNKTRREIVDLGVQLGKINIAAWASKDEKEKSFCGNKLRDVEQIEYAKRAAAWEEAENSKHAARFKREEIRIQAWESQQKAKLEAEMRQIEAQIEQMRAQAQAKMVKKIALARQKSEEKRAAAEARKNKQAEKVTVQADYIRQTGRIPSTYFSCCG